MFMFIDRNLIVYVMFILLDHTTRYTVGVIKHVCVQNINVLRYPHSELAPNKDIRPNNQQKICGEYGFIAENNIHENQI